MNKNELENFSDPEWLQNNSFFALSTIASYIEQDESKARDCLIRILEHRDIFEGYNQIMDSLIQRVGLFPYLDNVNNSNFATSDLLNIEAHIPEGLDGIILHSKQVTVYRALMDGSNVILSAPTSFGKSLLIDAAIASGNYDQVVVIVPTIALIDETRRRLSERFGHVFKIITHPTQAKGNRNIYVFTQERFLEYENDILPQLFVIDEFYKLSPNQKDNRTFVLNQAFYKLYKSGAQFFMIGPKVSDITIDQEELNFRYFNTNYSTVVAEIRNLSNRDTKSATLEICKNMTSPTLIFCKSSNSAYDLAHYLIRNGVSAQNQDTLKFSQWLADNYHPDWDLVSLLKEGVAIHHGALPRSVAYHILRKFNDGSIRFLLCTSTIIEGVNTAAENIVIYDNKIATRKFDIFTFNNIKGRAGRMFQHFVGNVYVLNYDYQSELPSIDIPALTQPEDTPESLLIQIDDHDLSEQSREKLTYLRSQEYLPLDIIRKNKGISPEIQVELAKEITTNFDEYHDKLSWERFPTNTQLSESCNLIFDYLMEGKPSDGILSGKQMSYKVGKFSELKEIKPLIQHELDNNARVQTATEAVEEVLIFLRRWAEFHFPKYLLALDNIQEHVFSMKGYSIGNYETYAAEMKKLFMPLSATVLEEYGIPYQITLKLESYKSLGNTVDDILTSLKEVDFSNVELTSFEREILEEAIQSL